MSPNQSLLRWLALPYAAWAGIVFLLWGSIALLLILFLPRLSWRRRVTHAAARLALFLCGMRVRVLHGERLPAGSCVVVANHASYLDGVALFAALPPSFGFVIKREMNDVPLAGLLLRRIGSHFVDRSGASQGKRDARALLREAQVGGAMAFFPEGTFQPQPGLGRFRPGAFVIAARGRLPVVPIAIRGTRHALPPGTMLPLPGRLDVELAPVIDPPTPGDAGSLEAVMNTARREILARIPEPDLAPGG